MKWKSHQRGSALLLVLWSIITMSVAVLGVVEYIHYNLDETQGLNLNFELRQIAESGIAVAFSPQISEGDPLLMADMGTNGGRYEVVLHSETARLHINQILQKGREDILQRLFVAWGAPSSDARMVVAKLILWSGRTGDATDNYSVEREFASVEQMRDVEGMDKIEKLHPDWMSAFTIWGNGKIDVNDASADILRAFFGIGERKAESFVQSRSGPDKKEHTLDDQPYTDMKLLAGALGFTDKQFAPYAQQVSLETLLTRAESTAFLNERKHQIRVIFNRKAQPPVIYQWQEVPL
ncbi:MAG: hypothetical protein ABIT76_01890 [Chthoniobacterales bacterium]